VTANSLEAWSARRAMATHEAGHTIFALDLGAIVVHVSIADGGGVSLISVPEDDAWVRLLISLAGIECEAEYNRRAPGYPNEPWCWAGDGSHDDDALALDFARTLARSDELSPKATIETGKRECRAMITDQNRWQRVEAVAEALEQFGRLTASELAALLEPKEASSA